MGFGGKRVIAITLGVCLMGGQCSFADVATTVVLRQGLDGYSGTSDTILFKDYASNSAGSFPYVFAGTNKFNNAARRSLLKFEFAAIVPATATVLSVNLQLYVQFDNAGVVTNTLHRMTRSWNEGANPLVDPQTVGQGAPAQAGDSTWSHVSYGSVLWTTPGGEFVSAPSASGAAGEPGSFLVFSGAGLVSDIQAWVEAPSTNHGWALLGDESVSQTAKRYYSSEADSTVSSLRPQLTIHYVVHSGVRDWALY